MVVEQEIFCFKIFLKELFQELVVIPLSFLINFIIPFKEWLSLKEYFMIMRN